MFFWFKGVEYFHWVTNTATYLLHFTNNQQHHMIELGLISSMKTKLCSNAKVRILCFMHFFILFVEFANAVGLQFDIACLSPVLYIDVTVEYLNNCGYCVLVICAVGFTNYSMNIFINLFENLSDIFMVHTIS